MSPWPLAMVQPKSFPKAVEPLAFLNSALDDHPISNKPLDMVLWETLSGPPVSYAFFTLSYVTPYVDRFIAIQRGTKPPICDVEVRQTDWTTTIWVCSASGRMMSVHSNTGMYQSCLGVIGTILVDHLCWSMTKDSSCWHQGTKVEMVQLPHHAG